MLLEEILRYTFLTRERPTSETVEIADLSTEESQKRPLGSGIEEHTKGKIVILINRVLALICLLSFLYIIIYPIVIPTGKMPDIIQNTFSLTLGYFGSALVTYLEKRPK